MLIKKRSLDLFPSKQLHHYRQMAAAGGGGGGFGVGVISPALMHHPHPPQRNLLLLPPILSPGNSLSMLTVKGSSTGSYHGNGLNWRGCSDHYCRSSRRDHDDDSFFRIRHYDKNYNVLEHQHHHDQGGTPPPPSTKTAPMNKLDDGAIDCLGFPYNHHRRSVPDKLVVAVDVDEVLGSFVSALNKFIADRYSSNHSVSEYHVYEFFKIWNCSRDEADVRVHEFFKTPYFKTGIHPIPGARSALHKLASFCNLSVVTSRQNAIKDHTIEWIEKHYPGLFEEIHFGNHFALDGISRPKSDICRSLGAQVLIDDNPRYAMECAEVGIRVLLFDYENSYPWCKTGSATLHPLVTKVHNWEEVEQQLVSWIISS